MLFGSQAVFAIEAMVEPDLPQPSGEQFDKAGKSFLACPSNSVAKLLSRPAPDKPVEVLTASSINIQHTIGEFCGWYEQKEKWLSNGHVA